jgi:D-alanine--poly(phosphoribitol) ligase subunit 2
MNKARADVEKAIESKVIELAHALGIEDAHSLSPDEVIAEKGWLDSAALMELVLWFEVSYCGEIPQEDLTRERFGTIRAMADYLERCGKL